MSGTPIIAAEVNLVRAWIENNRRYVAEKTDGKVGYIYVPNTGIDGQDDLVRQLYGQLDLATRLAPGSEMHVDQRNGGIGRRYVSGAVQASRLR